MQIAAGETRASFCHERERHKAASAATANVYGIAVAATFARAVATSSVASAE